MSYPLRVLVLPRARGRSAPTARTRASGRIGCGRLEQLSEIERE